MSRLKYHAAFLHAFLVEMTFLLSFYLFLNIHNMAGDRNHVSFFLTVTVLQYLAAHLIARWLPVKYVYILVPATLTVTLLAGDYFLSALLISTLPVWRLEQLLYTLNDNLAPQSLVAGLIWLIIITLVSTPEVTSHFGAFNLIYIIALTGYFSGKILTLAMDSGYGGRLYIRLVSSFILMFIVLGVAMTQVYRLAVFTLSYAVIFLLNAMVFMLRPFFDFLESVELDYPEDIFQEDETQLNGHQSPEEVISETDRALGIPFGAIVLALVVIGVIFAIWSYFRQRDPAVREQVQDNRKHNTVDHTPVSVPIPKKAPACKARRLYFDFEKWAASKGHGRYADETIEQWFRRLSLHEHTSVSKLEHYQEMRYKDKKLTKDELENLKSYIKAFKNILNKKA